MLGKYYYQAVDFKKSKNYFSEVVDACNHSGDTKGLAKALAERGNYELFNDTGKLSDVTKALALFKKKDDKVGQSEMLAKIAEIHFIYGLWMECEKELLRAVDLEKEVDLNIFIITTALAFMAQAKEHGYGAFLCQSGHQYGRKNDLAFSSFFILEKEMYMEGWRIGKDRNTGIQKSMRLPAKPIRIAYGTQVLFGYPLILSYQKSIRKRLI
jgi:hypothetical protein